MYQGLNNTCILRLQVIGKDDGVAELNEKNIFIKRYKLVADVRTTVQRFTKTLLTWALSPLNVELGGVMKPWPSLSMVISVLSSSAKA